MDNLLENISVKEARALIEVVTALAKGCAFTKLEFQQIASICNKCIDRMMNDREKLNE
jgi:hypothetical protein